MISERMQTLLQATAAQLRDGISPLNHEFLVEHEVTLDEVYDLSDLLATAVDSLIELVKTPSGQRLVAVAIANAAIEKIVARKESGS